MNKLALGLIALTAFNCPALCAEPEDVIGVVMSFSGTWTLLPKSKKRPRTVKPFEAVPDGAKFVPKKATDKIEILLRDKTEIRRTGTRDSHKAITLSGPPSTLDLLAKALGLLGHHAERFVPTLAKGPQNYATEAVVRVSDEQLDLGPPFLNLPAGDYKIDLAPIDSAGNKGTSLGPFSISWKPKESESCNTPGISAGLYEITLKKSDGTPTGSQSWILVSQSSDYDKNSESLRSVSQMTSVQENARSLSARALLRASLRALSGQESNEVSQSHAH